jgi:Leucine-rich repeat (LRR) protein
MNKEFKDKINECIKNKDKILMYCGLLKNLPFDMLSLENLISLELENCKIESLDNLPPNLKYLNLTGNLIKEIKTGQLLKNLEIINLNNNIISSIDENSLPINLKELYLNYNKLNIINFDIPQTLTKIHIKGNKLSIIDRLFIYINIEEIDISLNEIENINLDPNSNLITFDCSHNNINYINKLPNNIVNLDLSFNKFTEFNIDLPSSIKNYNISNNKIKKNNLTNIKNQSINDIWNINNEDINDMTVLFDNINDNYNNKIEWNVINKEQIYVDDYSHQKNQSINDIWNINNEDINDMTILFDNDNYNNKIEWNVINKEQIYVDDYSHQKNLDKFGYKNNSGKNWTFYNKDNTNDIDSKYNEVLEKTKNNKRYISFSNVTNNINKLEVYPIDPYVIVFNKVCYL